MKPFKGTKTPACQFCDTLHEFNDLVKKFICTECGVSQHVVPSVNVRETVGHNKTGHYLPPSGGRK